MKAVDRIREASELRPKIGLVLGSGLGNFAESIEDPVTIPYKDLEGFVSSSVQGHKGEFILGKLNGVEILAMNGRIHYYEGHSIDQVVYPMKVMADLGIEKVIITNAAGGVNKDFQPGDLMLITDHINFTGVNPLMGKNDDNLGPRFLDMTHAYPKDLQDLAIEAAKEEGIFLQEGVYMWFTGPSYETAAEVRLARTVGGDAVGMSTVPEVLVAHHRGVEVLGISLITNHATGVSDQVLSHQEVVEVSKKAEGNFKKLVTRIIERLGHAY